MSSYQHSLREAMARCKHLFSIYLAAVIGLFNTIDDEMLMKETHFFLVFYYNSKKLLTVISIFFLDLWFYTCHIQLHNFSEHIQQIKTIEQTGIIYEASYFHFARLHFHVDSCVISPHQKREGILTFDRKTEEKNQQCPSSSNDFVLLG